MFENINLIYIVVAAFLLLTVMLTGIKLRTKYVKSLLNKISEQEVMQGKTINQLAALKSINQNLELNNKRQIEQIDEMIKVNNSHSNKLSESYKSSQELISDLKLANDKIEHLERKINESESHHENEMLKHAGSFDDIKLAYKKMSHSFEILQKSNDNLREERDFYRKEFIQLRDSEKKVKLVRPELKITA